MSKEYVEKLRYNWANSSDGSSWEEFLERHVQEMRDFIRYWSYCTSVGMSRSCPEKCDELGDAMIGFGIAPWMIAAKAEVSNG